MQNQPSFTERRVPRSHGSVYVRDYAGAGPAFVLMHGLPDNLYIYDYLIPLLAARGRHVVAFDFLGFGESDKLAGATYSFGQQLGDLKAVIDALGLEKIIPVAHDSSGSAAINFAIDYPERTTSLVILNALYAQAPALRLPELIELFALTNLKALTSTLLQSPDQFGWVVDFQRGRFQASLSDKHRQRYDAFLGPVIDRNFRGGAVTAFAQMTGHLFEDIARNTARIPELEALDIPAKLIWGVNDPYLNVGVAEDLQSHLSHASLHRIPAGHWVQIDEPELVASAMLS
jgi:pimeloyl-ACP methyl ester carboxylesterase